MWTMERSTMLRTAIVGAAGELGVTLKPEQEEAILSYTSGHDTVLLAPTGFGKSMIFQIAPLVFEEARKMDPSFKPKPVRTLPSDTIDDIFIILMPITALIENAVQSIENIHGFNHTGIQLTQATLPAAPTVTFIFTSPEYLLDQSGRSLLSDQNVCKRVRAVFVDEMHVIRTWGTDSDKTDKPFREAYGELGQLRSFLSEVPIVCMSATVTKETLTTCSDSLQLDSPNIISVDINKENITYHLRSLSSQKLNNFQWLVDIIKNHGHQTPRMLIFFLSADRLSEAYHYVRKAVNQRLNPRMPICGMYHKLTLPRIKAQVQAGIADEMGSYRVLFCTKSLGMGVDIKTVDLVVHYGLPTEVETFLQETGRSGRQPGSHAHSTLITYPGMSVGQSVSKSMNNYKNATTCRRKHLLEEFMPSTDLVSSSQCCDICQPALSCAVTVAIDKMLSSAPTTVPSNPGQSVHSSDTDSIVSGGQVEDLG